MACTSSVQEPSYAAGRTQNSATPAERLSAILLEFPAKTLARLTGTSIDTVKSWQAARRFPNWENIKSLQSQLPAVRRLVANELGFAENPYASLMMLANDSTQQAAEARASLRTLMRGGE